MKPGDKNNKSQLVQSKKEKFTIIGKNGTKITSRVLKKNRLIPKHGGKSTRGVVFLNRIPHGFYENEMREFFSQFGQVTDINMPRSKSTGRSRHYAFVEFMYPDVAKVVAETMDNYLMFNCVIKAKYFPPEEQKPHLFKFKSNSGIPLVEKRRIFLRERGRKVLNEEELAGEQARIKTAYDNMMKRVRKYSNDYKFQLGFHNSGPNEEKSKSSEENGKTPGKKPKKSLKSEKKTPKSRRSVTFSSKVTKFLYQSA